MRVPSSVNDVSKNVLEQLVVTEETGEARLRVGGKQKRELIYHFKIIFSVYCDILSFVYKYIWCFFVER